MDLVAGLFIQELKRRHQMIQISNHLRDILIPFDIPEKRYAPIELKIFVI